MFLYCPWYNYVAIFQIKLACARDLEPDEAGVPANAPLPGQSSMTLNDSAYVK
jgi:hypothetical protein